MNRTVIMRIALYVAYPILIASLAVFGLAHLFH